MVSVCEVTREKALFHMAGSDVGENTLSGGSLSSAHENSKNKIFLIIKIELAFKNQFYFTYRLSQILFIILGN